MASPASIPSTMRAWQFTPGGGRMERDMKLNPSAPLPKRKSNTYLVEVIAAALNPVDYKPIEIPFVSKLILPNPTTPCLDFCGRVVQPADGSDVKPGDIIFGYAGVHLLGGALAQYTIAKKDGVAVLPTGVDTNSGASICIAGLTAIQSIKPHVKQGSSVFINGGSGGTGIFGIQIAKALGCYVTTTCSTPNVDLCKSLGADEVIDYKTQSVLEALKSTGRKYDHIVDNVGSDYSLFWKAHEYTTSNAVYVTVGGTVSWSHALETVKVKMWPGFLGGGKRKPLGMRASPNAQDLAQIGKWMQEGQVKPIIEAVYKFEDAPKAFERLRTGRTKGKLVVEVSPSAENK